MAGKCIECEYIIVELYLPIKNMLVKKLAVKLNLKHTIINTLPIICIGIIVIISM